MGPQAGCCCCCLLWHWHEGRQSPHVVLGGRLRISIASLAVCLCAIRSQRMQAACVQSAAAAPARQAAPSALRTSFVGSSSLQPSCSYRPQAALLLRAQPTRAGRRQAAAVSCSAKAPWADRPPAR